MQFCFMQDHRTTDGISTWDSYGRNFSSKMFCATLMDLRIVYCFRNFTFFWPNSWGCRLVGLRKVGVEKWWLHLYSKCKGLLNIWIKVMNPPQWWFSDPSKLNSWFSFKPSFIYNNVKSIICRNEITMPRRRVPLYWWLYIR